jgi:uncharacterized protein YndB with AHSA1/START domain
MKTLKFKFTAVAAIAAVLLSFALSLTGCPPGEVEGEDPDKPNPDKPKTGENFKIEGKYHFINDTTKVVYNWEFTDKSFEIVWKQSNSDRKTSGTYTVSGNDVTLQLADVMGQKPPAEVYAASKSGDKVTLTLKEGTTSMVLASFSMAGKTITLTEGVGEVKPEEFTALHMGTTWTYIIEGGGSNRTVTLTDCEVTYDSFPLVAEPDTYYSYKNDGQGLQTLTLPSTLANLPVTAINNEAILSSGYISSTTYAESVIIPDSIRRIGNEGADANKYYWSTYKITIGANVDIQTIIGIYGDAIFNSCYNSNGKQKSVYYCKSNPPASGEGATIPYWTKAN